MAWLCHDRWSYVAKVPIQDRLKSRAADVACSINVFRVSPPFMWYASTMNVRRDHEDDVARI